jgi:hypothetical protein
MRTARTASCSAALAVVLTCTALAQAPAKQTATQFYVDYRAKFDKATKIEDILPYMSAKNVKQAEAQPKADRDKMFGVIKLLGSISDLKVTKEEPTPDGGVILTAEGLSASLSDPAKKDKQAGKITIVKEGGAWKVGDESWH